MRRLRDEAAEWARNWITLPGEDIDCRRVTTLLSHIATKLLASYALWKARIAYRAKRDMFKRYASFI